MIPNYLIRSSVIDQIRQLFTKSTFLPKRDGRGSNFTGFRENKTKRTK